MTTDPRRSIYAYYNFGDRRRDVSVIVSAVDTDESGHYAVPLDNIDDWLRLLPQLQHLLSEFGRCDGGQA